MPKHVYLFLLFTVIFSPVVGKALESTDVLDVTIMQVYSKNVLVLSRGAEDGVTEKDHVKISSSEGFVARGICIKSSLLSSHWKIYRVVRPELMSKDSTYKMTSINQSEVPARMLKFSNVDFTKKPDQDPVKELKLQQKRILKYDLPDKVSESRSIKVKPKTEFQKFIDTNFSKGTIHKDFSQARFEVFTSPISIETREDKKELHYGAKVKNYGEKYRYEFIAVEKQITLLDPVTKEGYKSKSTHYGLDFEINRLTENMSIISKVSYDQEKIGDIYYPHKYTQIAPLGFRYHLWEEDPRDQFMDISYLPILDSMEYTNIDKDKIDQRDGLRHELSLRIFSTFTKNVKNQTILSYLPFMSLDDLGAFDDGNLLTNISTTFIYDFQNDISMEYQAHYENDPFRAANYGVGQDNLSQTFRIRYAWDI